MAWFPSVKIKVGFKLIIDRSFLRARKKKYIRLQKYFPLRTKDKHNTVSRRKSLAASTSQSLPLSPIFAEVERARRIAL